MATITLPSGFSPRRCQLRLATTARTHASPYGGSEQAVDLLNDRWLLSLELPPRAGYDAAAGIEAFLAALRGPVNTCNLWHFARPSVRGTLASATCGAASQGASSVTLTGTGTLKAGDMLGIGGLLLQVAADVTLSGSGSVSLVNRLRTAISGGSAVTFTRPTAAFRLVTQGAGVSYVPRASEPLALEFAEVVA